MAGWGTRGFWVVGEVPFPAPGAGHVALSVKCTKCTFLYSDAAMKTLHLLPEVMEAFNESIPAAVIWVYAYVKHRWAIH